MAKTKYPTLLSPAKIGNVEIRNRTIMAAMGMSQSDNGFVNKATINHYAARAKGGVGAIIVEVTCVDTPLGLNTNGMLVIDDDKYIPGMADLAAAIHDGGAKAFLQISHTGRGARRAIIGQQPVGPSAVAMPYSYMMGLGNETPRELTIDEIHAIEEKYAQAALRAKKAGFDGVEIHSVGYYLGQQFLSSTANIRKDEYGGSRANRCRFHLNIIKRIRELCGDEFAIIMKLSVVEQGTDGGISIPDGIYYTKKFQEAGVDAIEVLAGKWSSESGKNERPESGYKDNMTMPLCQVLKYGLLATTGHKKTITLIGCGHTQNPVAAEKALKNGTCEFVSIGHGLLVEPELVNKFAEGREDEIRPCIGCGHCIDHQLQHGGKAVCSGNAVLARGDNDYSIAKAKKKKHVVVIGAGVAGVEAARIAAMRGHIVDLYDSNKYVGGALEVAKRPPFKENFLPLQPYLERQLELTGVKVHLGKTVDAKDIQKMKPDAVVCATGAKSVVLPIEGADKTVLAKDVLLGKVKTGKNVVVIGGGSTGCETAEMLAMDKKNVTVLELTDKLAANTGKTAQTVLMGHLKGYGAKLLTECKAEKITKNSVVYTDKEGKEHTLKADTVVMAVGEKPDATLYESLQGKVKELYNIGDSNGGAILPNAVFEGYTVGNQI